MDKTDSQKVHEQAVNPKGTWMAGVVLKGQRKTRSRPAAVWCAVGGQKPSACLADGWKHAELQHFRQNEQCAARPSEEMQVGSSRILHGLMEPQPLTAGIKTSTLHLISHAVR